MPPTMHSRNKSNHNGSYLSVLLWLHTGNRLDPIDGVLCYKTNCNDCTMGAFNTSLALDT